MMHVAICSDGVFPEKIGGMQRHTRMLVETLAQMKPDVQITLLHTHPGFRFFQHLANVEEVAVPPKPRKATYLKECFDLSRRFAAELHRIPDAIVYSQGLCVLADIASFSHRLIVNPHGLEAFQAIDLRTWAQGVPMRMLQRRTFRHAKHVVSLGGRLSAILERETRNTPGKVVVLPNGVMAPADHQVRREFGPGHAPLRLLFVGRLAANKGVSYLLEAMQILSARGRAAEVELRIVGDGPLFASLSAKSGLRGVEFLRGVDDSELERLYASSDALVLPTLFEGMPTVVLEAMARCLPVLVTDVGATRELVDSSNGAIVPKRDSRGLAQAIIELIDAGPDARNAMGKAGRRRIEERFTWNRVAEAHHELFLKVLMDRD